MRKPKSITRWLGMAMVGLMAGIMGGCMDSGAHADIPPKAVRPVKAIQLTRIVGDHALVFPATAKSLREVRLSFRVGGPLIGLDAENGQKVVKGQMIARIDPRDFEIAIKTLEAKLAASKAHLEEATLQYHRYAHLFNQNAAAKAKYDNARATFQMAEAQVKADTESLADAKNDLIDTRLIAPFTGYVNDELVENHETVTQGQPIVSLVDLKTIEVVLGLPEDLVGRLSDFNSYRVAFEAVPGSEFAATLKEVGKTPDPTSRAYPLTLILEPAATPLVRPGMAAQVRINVSADAGKDRFAIPVQALFNSGGDTSSVWIFDAQTQTVSRQEVFVERLNRQGVEISGDLAPGQWVVSAGVHHLQPGQRVRLLKKPSPTNVGAMR
ncbi:efflux RND transporter periplasmic adaptor subunit [Desulfosarcina ovata]|uniref:RND transporter n=1 Tax=Desulfosarcina ovata subsp. ovata TaxID=2752305 RepID=A0A5K8ADK1_9BACT|nr:efflux RND transporter periplasmic adaptor subunit [Desulfosarcina ovata]BBO90568.1 RND transporter [Desulfosarcina ovata subsp. ovata]